MSWIIKTDDNERREQLRGEMRREMQMRHGGESAYRSGGYEQGYREGYREGYEQSARDQGMWPKEEKEPSGGSAPKSTYMVAPYNR